MFFFLVVSSVDLYDETAFFTDEIYDVSTNWGLPIEFQAHQPPIAQS